MLGAGAHLHDFAGLRSLAWGYEHFGPHILTEDHAVAPVKIVDVRIYLPSGPGLGVALDPDELRRFARA